MEYSFTENIFRSEPAHFREMALEVFHFQYQNNELYRSYTDTLKIVPEKVKEIEQVPFLPVGFFKTHAIKTGSFDPALIFESSGTTHTTNSHHYIKDPSIYTKSFTLGFERFYGNVEEWCIIGLLPSYLERNNSSLVVMVDELISKSHHSQSGFYLYDHNKLHAVLLQLEKQQQKTLVIGVTFALLDFAEQFNMQLQHTIIMETGGMKGRRREMTRQEVHGLLQQRLGVTEIHSEYGMTELLSQAWSKGGGIFEPVPWMKALVRHEDDPFDVQQQGTGIINIIDLANIYSCSFIATEDAGRVFSDGSFEVLGRVDNSDIRGCSLLVV